MLRFVMRTTLSRDLTGYKEEIPQLELCVDTQKNAYFNFCKALEMAGNDPCIHFEDDVLLCDNFVEKAMKEINEHPKDVIQFFSRRKDDLRIGSRYINGSQFSFNVCFYLPEKMGLEMLQVAREWWAEKGDASVAYDWMMADFFKARKIKYWNVVPNIVDHKIGRSLISPKRSSRRVSLTFQNHDI